MRRKQAEGATDWQLVKRLLRLPPPERSGEAMMILSVLGNREALGRIGFADFSTYSAWRGWAERMYAMPYRPAFKALVQVRGERE